jgi:putative restriction endonuclease
MSSSTSTIVPTAKYWWVNHRKAHRQEIDGECLWSPKSNKNGASNESYSNMTRVMPGDVMFSFASGAIRAIGVATGHAREALPPPSFGKGGHRWGDRPGWQLSVRFGELEMPLRTKDHATELAAVLPTKYSPIRESGGGNQGVYLAAVPDEMVAVLRRLLAGQLEKVVDEVVQSTGPELTEVMAEEAIQQRTDIGPSEKAILIKARRGQGIYRDNLERIEHKCRITGLLDRRHLRASHIKPWKDSTDAEKLDGFNGLLLSPHFAHLFARGYISFADSGDILISRDLNRAVVKCWGIDAGKNVGVFRPEQARYLDFHRREVFERQAGGRRNGGKA